MTNKVQKTGLAGAIGVLLMLQPAAALSAFEPNNGLSVEAAPTSATDAAVAVGDDPHKYE